MSYVQKIKTCKMYNVDNSFWNDIVFSDKSKLWPFSRKKEYVRKQKGPQFYDKYINKLWNLEVWVPGTIKRRNKVLIKCSNRLISVGHNEVLKKGLLLVSQEQNIFQQVDTLCQTSMFISSFMHTKRICLLSD